MQVTVEIPDHLAQHLIPAGQDAARTLLEDAALKAFVESRISRSELRALLHFETRYELDGFLKQRGIGHDSYTADDLDQDVRIMDALRKEPIGLAER